MSEPAFDSSDSVRSGKPLKYVKHVTFRQPLKLELGGELPELTLAYETYGRLNARKDNAVLICHALSGDSHVAKHDKKDDPGWWDIAVGPGKAIDTDHYYVICPNILGGCRGTTGPGSVNPANGKPYGRDFPTITIGDMVHAQKRLTDSLGIGRLLAVIGGSMGGHQALYWGLKHPASVRGVVPLATSPRLTTQALAFDVVSRNAIMLDPDFHGGAYYDHDCVPHVGLAIARMIGHITYLSPEAMNQKFEADRFAPRDVPTEFEKKFSVGSYLGYQGDKFVERFDANSYITITMAMDLFDLGGTEEEMKAAFAASEARWLIVSFSSDWLFPPEQSQQMVNALLANQKAVSYCNVTSTCGHDAFLLPNDLDRYGEMVRGFLANLSGTPLVRMEGDEDAFGGGPTSIFHRKRLDYDMIVDLVPPQSSVLDLGCGQGTLMGRLAAAGHLPLVGLELDERAIVHCVRQGLDVIHADLDRGLSQFADGQFDCVVLSQTLQAVRDVERIVRDMLRVGSQCIVSFPNFGYWKLRQMLAEQGKAPESGGMLRFKWYNSPNIRFFTIADFEEFCREKSIRIHRMIAMDSEEGSVVHGDPNRNADLAIFVISR